MHSMLSLAESEDLVEQYALEVTAAEGLLLGEVFSPAAVHLLQEGGVTVALCRV